jgi:hypothetical protein
VILLSNSYYFFLGFPFFFVLDLYILFVLQLAESVSLDSEINCGDKGLTRETHEQHGRNHHHGLGNKRCSVPDISGQDRLRCHECGWRLFCSVLHSSDGFKILRSRHGIIPLFSPHLNSSSHALLSLFNGPTVNIEFDHRHLQLGEAMISCAKQLIMWQIGLKAKHSRPSSPTGAKRGVTWSRIPNCCGSGQKRA